MKRNQNDVTSLNKFLLMVVFAKTCIKALYMHHNNCVTRKLCTYSCTNASVIDINALCICMQPYLFTFLQLKQLAKLFELFVKHNSNTFVFDRKQFCEIMIVREHKRV